MPGSSVSESSAIFVGTPRRSSIGTRRMTDGAPHTLSSAK
jgi:hypothetical protein